MRENFQLKLFGRLGREWRPRFFMVWIGQAFSLFGSSLVSFALVWYLTYLYHSETVLAVGTLVTILPTIALGPFAGALVDRWNRRAVMIASDSCVAVLTLGLMLAFRIGPVQPWLLYVVMFLRSLGGAFQSPAMMASTTLMVPREQLTRVGGMNQTLNGVIKIVAPPAGAFLVLLFHVMDGGLLRYGQMAWVLSIDVFTVVFAVTPLLFIHIPQPERAAHELAAPSLLRETASGFAYVWAWRALFFIVFTCTLANIFLGPAGSFLPLLVTRVFSASVSPDKATLMISSVSSASGIGVIVGGIFMSVWGGFRRKLITSATGWIGIGAGYIVITIAANLVSPPFAVLLAMIFLIGFMTPVGCAPLDAFYQSCIPPDKQGRVFAVLGSIDGATMPLGLAFAVVMGDAMPLWVYYLVVGASHTLIGIAWMIFRFIRTAEDEATQRNLAV